MANGPETPAVTFWLSHEAKGVDPLARASRERLQDWETLAARAYPPNTLRAWRADWALYDAWCHRTQLPALPARPQDLAAFVYDQLNAGKKPATVRRYLATVARAHLAAGLSSPCASEPVRLALKTMGRTVPARQRQALGFGWEQIRKFLLSAGTGIRADRERALLCVAYDTLARRSELVAFNVEDMNFEADGSGTALIRRSKTDPTGQGALAYLAPDTVQHLKKWMAAARLTEGALFRRLVGRSRVGERLHADQVSDIYKRVAAWIGMPEAQVAQVSGHSIRIGATQDLVALNIDLPSIQQAGRWRTPAMPARYSQALAASRGAISRAAKLQQRD